MTDAIARLPDVYKYLDAVGQANAVGLSLKLDIPLALVRSELNRLKKEKAIEEFGVDWWKASEKLEVRS